MPVCAPTGSFGTCWEWVPARPGFGGVATTVTAPAEREAAFHRFVVPELEVLYGVALAMTRDRADAEDLVQDTLLRAFQGIDRFDGKHPRAWLLTILRNAQANRHRRQRPGLLRDADRLEEYAEATSPDAGPEGIAMAAVFDWVVESAFAGLSEDQQTVLCLVDVDGLSYQEAADVLGVPVGTVMSRLHRGRKRIKRKLVGAGLAARRMVG